MHSINIGVSLPRSACNGFIQGDSLWSLHRAQLSNLSQNRQFRSSSENDFMYRSILMYVQWDGI